MTAPEISLLSSRLIQPCKNKTFFNFGLFINAPGDIFQILASTFSIITSKEVSGFVSFITADFSPGIIDLEKISKIFLIGGPLTKIFFLSIYLVLKG